MPTENLLPFEKGMAKQIRHPAKFTDSLLPVFREILSEWGVEKVLDPFAGTGKIHTLPFRTFGLEIEPEWASQHKRTMQADAREMPFKSGCFDGICTSPTYGNRMADCHNAQDGSRRNTYTHTLGRPLHSGNSGKMQWGEEYRNLHRIVWKECHRVLKSRGGLILNMKNHIRKGKEIDVFGWHVVRLIKTGFKLRSVRQVRTPGNRFGQNGASRLDFEYVATFEK
jgi:hypothetical protein